MASIGSFNIQGNLSILNCSPIFFQAVPSYSCFRKLQGTLYWGERYWIQRFKISQGYHRVHVPGMY